MIIFEKQLQHYLSLAALLVTLFVLLPKVALAGQFYGISTTTWLILTIADPIVHQIYVWFMWRTELHFSLITRWLGENGFTIYAAGFTILFALRLLLIIALALSNRNSLSLNPVISFLLAVVCLLPALYLFYSVRRYFGFRRAYGIDHFDASYRHLEFVREGIFRFTPNAMYVFGFLILWVPGFLLFSKAALLAALFNHSYIWAHYFFTELPDIRRIYGEPNSV